MKKRWHQPFVSWLQDAVFPVACVGCGEPNVQVCTRCWQGVPIRSFNESYEPLHIDSALDRVFIASWYDNQPLQYSIKQAKYYGAQTLLEPLAHVLISFWNTSELSDYFSLSETVIIPMPLHPRRLRERGYNQSEILAQYVAQAVSIPCESHFVQRVRYTKHQASLSQADRLQNVSQAFATCAGLTIPDQVLIVDDVITTGASCNELAEVLKQAGVHKVFVLVLAKH